DWHDDGTKPTEGEHHFGTVRYEYHAGRDPVYDPKPAYLAARTLTRSLSGFRFDRRLEGGGAEDYVLRFRRGRETRLAVWTRAAGSRRVTIPGQTGRFTVTSHLGAALPPLAADGDGLSVTLTEAPQYLAPSSR